MRNAWSFTAGYGAQDPVGTTRTTRIVRIEGHLQTNGSEVTRVGSSLKANCTGGD